MRRINNPDWNELLSTNATHGQSGGRFARYFYVGAIALIVIVKLVTLWTFWDDRLGDYSRLERFANIILTSSSWLTDAGVGREAFPPELWKTPGFPLLIAAMKLLLHGSWPIGLFVINSTVSLVAGFYLRRMARAFRFGSVLATIVFVLYEFSVPASTDVLIMPDGLYGSLATIALCIVGTQLLDRGDVTYRRMSEAGIIIAICFFLREGFIYLVIPIALALVIPAWLTGTPIRRVAVLMLAISLPTSICAATIASWNRYRTGYFMIANVNQVVFMTALMNMAKMEKGVFAGSDPIDRAARETYSDYAYGDAQNVTIKLFNEYGIKAPEADRITREKFWHAVAAYPFVYLRTMADRFRLRQQASMIGSLVTRLDDLDYWRQVVYGKDYYGGWRGKALTFRQTMDWRLLTPGLVLRMGLHVMAYALTLPLFIAFMLLLPPLALYEAVTKSDPYWRRRAFFFLGLYLLYWSFFSVHLLVTVEIRYFGAICAIPILGSMYLLMRVYQHRSALPFRRSA